MNFYRYLDDDVSDLKQENGILACLNLHGYLVVYMSVLFQVPWGADMPECYRYLGVDMSELLQVAWC
jgi:hypothetical protein